MEDGNETNEKKLPENNHDLNQLCKKALKQVGQVADPCYLYWLQFLDWALDSGELQLDQSDYRVPALLSTLDLLRRSDPALVMKFLVQPPGENDPEEEELVADPKKKWEPVDLAGQLLGHLDSRLSASLNNYPRANPLS